MGGLDYAVLFGLGALTLAIGIRAGRRPESTSELDLASRNLPTWAVMGSMVATELSAATFIGVPHAAYAGDWSYFQLAFGALIGKLLVGVRVIPLYHRLRVVTVYGFLKQRFGPSSQRAAALAFTVGRILASGVRLFIAALAFAAATGAHIEIAIVVCGVVAGLYTSSGGIRAVVWTDVMQAAVFLAGAALLAAVLVHSAGGASEILAWARTGARTRVLHLDPLFSLSDPRPLVAGIVGGFFLTLATHATDHDMVQRLLTTRDGRSGGRALIGSALLNFPITLLFLGIGTGLAYFYASEPNYDLGDGVRVVPLFALHELPDGARGLVFAGLFAAALSSLDSAICAIATTWVNDVRPNSRSGDERSAVLHTRITYATVCALLIVAALGMSAYHAALQAGTADDGAGLSLVEVSLSAMTILYGGLLGVFGLGWIGGRGNDRSAVWGLLAGGSTGLALFLHPIAVGHVVVAWTWWVPISATVAFGVAAAGRPHARATSEA